MRWLEKERKGEVKQRDPGIGSEPSQPGRHLRFLFFFLFDLGRDGTLGKGVKKCGEKSEKGGKSV